MLTRMLNYAAQYEMLRRGDSVVAAVSGGADSVCMLHLLKRASEELGFSLMAAHFDHRLRGEESRRDAAFTENLCKTLGIPFVLGEADENAYSASGTEDTARRLRYAFLRSAALENGANKIATAHTADDNAETVVMRLARGTGARGLAGIPPVRGDVIRPILFASRGDVEAYLDENGLPHAEDSTNAQDVYTRNRLRHNVMPHLRALNPALSEAVTDMTELLRADDDYLTGEATKLVSGACADVTALSAAPYPIASRAVRLMFPGEISRRHVDAVLDLCRTAGASSQLDLPGAAAVFSYGRLTFKPQDRAKTFAPVAIAPGETVSLPGLTVRCTESVAEKGDIINKSFTTFLFKSAILSGTIMLRPRVSGDEIHLHGRGVTKSVKKLCIESRIPADERGLLPVLADDKGVLGVYRLGIDSRAVPSPGDKIVKIEFEEASLNA